MQCKSSAGEIKRKAMEKIGSLEGAELLVAGEVVMYQPSLKSLKAGLEADRFFGKAQMNERNVAADVFTKAFGALLALRQDRIVINLRLIDAANGKSTNWTTIEGSSHEFGQPQGGFFDAKLMRTSGPLQTPMQMALRVCTI